MRFARCMRFADIVIVWTLSEIMSWPICILMLFYIDMGPAPPRRVFNPCSELHAGPLQKHLDTSQQVVLKIHLSTEGKVPMCWDTELPEKKHIFRTKRFPDKNGGKHMFGETFARGRVKQVH